MRRGSRLRISGVLLSFAALACGSSERTAIAGESSSRARETQALVPQAIGVNRWGACWMDGHESICCGQEPFGNDVRLVREVWMLDSVACRTFLDGTGECFARSSARSQWQLLEILPPVPRSSRF